MELGKKKKNTKLIRIIDIRDYGRNHDLFCNNNLLLRTARKPGDIERVNHTVLGCLNRAGVKYEIIDENKKSNIMKININESQLNRIISESVKKVLKEQFTQEINPQEIIEIVKKALETNNYEKDYHEFTNGKNGYYEGIIYIQFYGEGLNEDKTVLITAPFGVNYSPETYDTYWEPGCAEEISGGIDGVDKVELYYYNNGKWSEGIVVPNINKEIERILNDPRFEEFCAEELKEMLYEKFEDDAAYEDFQRTEYYDNLRKYGDD